MAHQRPVIGIYPKNAEALRPGKGQIQSVRGLAKGWVGMHPVYPLVSVLGHLIAQGIFYSFCHAQKLLLLKRLAADHGPAAWYARRQRHGAKSHKVSYSRVP